MEIELRKYVYRDYPYCDTFKYLNEEGTKLTNSLDAARAWNEQTYRKLQSLEGKSEIKDNPTYRGVRRPEDRSGEFRENDYGEEEVFSGPYDDWILLNDAVQTRADSNWILDSQSVTIHPNGETEDAETEDHRGEWPAHSHRRPVEYECGQSAQVCRARERQTVLLELPVFCRKPKTRWSLLCFK